jgi:DNA-binding helix-hairpin-helix protein with protein kinase domain
MAKYLQRIEWDSSMASPETRTPSHSFPLVASPQLALVGGSQGTDGALVNHELPKICEHTPIILYNVDRRRRSHKH